MAVFSSGRSAIDQFSSSSTESSDMQIEGSGLKNLCRYVFSEKKCLFLAMRLVQKMPSHTANIRNHERKTLT